MNSRSQALPQQLFWAGKTVVVAGATGFLGGWLVRRLLEYDANVVAIVREPNKQSQVFMDSLIDQTAFELGSVDDAAFLERIFEKYEIDAFFHCAYGADVNRVLREPVECFRSSVLSTLDPAGSDPARSAVLRRGRQFFRQGVRRADPSVP